MKDLLEICCGLDVHKETIVACLLKGTLTSEPQSEIREFSTLLPDLEKLKNWLISESCMHVAMESTGVYWFPIYDILEDAFNGNMNLVVANARHMKNVPGKKTDKNDASWIATLLRAGLLSSSFVPVKEIRELRDLTRYRKSIVSESSSQKNRIEKHLQSCGFKLSTFLTDIFGVSGRAIINYIADNGFISVVKVDEFVKSRARQKLNEIKIAVNGKMSPHQKEFLKLLLSHLDETYKNIGAIENLIEIALSKYQIEVSQIDSIPGVAKTAAASIIAEIGVDMSKFKTSEHICSWAGLSPRNEESAGKKKSTRVMHGNPYIKSILCEVAWSITRMRNSYLSKWFWKVKQRRGAKKAIIALARKILVIIYNLLKNKTFYDETIFDKTSQKLEKYKIKRLMSEAKKLGLQFTEPLPA